MLLAVIVSKDEWVLFSRAIEFLQWVQPINGLFVGRLEKVVPKRCASPGVAFLREMEAVDRQQR